MTQQDEHIYSVEELNGLASELLEEAFPSIQVTGELHEIRRPGSGHWYFTLKDEQAELRCVMFQGDNRQVTEIPNQGDQISLSGRLTIYGQRGQYQLIARRMKPAGIGLLLKRFEELRKRLIDEGLFDEERKKELPPVLQHLALITSSTGAAARDVLTVMARRAPLLPVTLVPAVVQGDRAPSSLCRAMDMVEQMRHQDLPPFDAVLLCRGGGSLEDLWAFNEEAVVRRISALSIPCVSGVGHETDFTLTDFVADLRAPTPSAAAEILTEKPQSWPVLLADRERYLAVHVEQAMGRQRQYLVALSKRLLSPARRLEQQAQRADEMSERLQRGMQRTLSAQGNRLRSATRFITNGGYAKSALAQGQQQLQNVYRELANTVAAQKRQAEVQLERQQLKLGALNPHSVLSRGYAILRDQAGLVRSDTRGMQTGDAVSAQLAQGRLELSIEAVEDAD